MKSFIFITNEGYTFEPGPDGIGPDIENEQVIGFAQGVDAEDAFKNLREEQEFLLETSFDEVSCMELKNFDRRYFYLNAPRKCSILLG